MTVEREPTIILIPAMPPDLALDLVFRTDRGFGVRVREEDVEALDARGVPHVELFASSNAYAAAMERAGSASQALAAVHGLQESRLAALSQDERDQFAIA